MTVKITKPEINVREQLTELRSGTSSSTTTNYYGRRNLVINGDMRIDQRNGGSSITGQNVYGTDRFRTQTSETNTTSEQVSDAPDGFNHSLKLTNAGTDTGSGAYREIKYVVEGSDIAHWQKDTQGLSFSFWAKSSLAGTYQILLRTDSGTRYFYSFEYTLSANTWTYVTHTLPPSPNSTLSSDNLSGLTFFFVQDYPTGWASGDSSAAWETTSTTSMAAFPQSWANTLNATFQVTGVQLEVGSATTPFEYRSYGEELNLCLRYYEDFQPGLYGVFGVGKCMGMAGTAIISVPIYPKRTAPSVSMSNMSDAMIGSYKSSLFAFYGIGTSYSFITNHDIGRERNCNIALLFNKPTYVGTNDMVTLSQSHTLVGGSIASGQAKLIFDAEL